MQVNLLQAAKRFFEPDTLVPFLIGTLFLSVTGNAFSDILKIVFGDKIQSLVGIIVVAIIIFIVCVFLVSKALDKSSQQYDLSRANPSKHRGLILLVSREEPCIKAIEQHLPKLEYCWLIHSSQSLPIVESLKKRYPQIKFINTDRLIIKDVFDPIEFTHLVTDIYQNLPSNYSKKEVIADFTGMTAQGSVGMAIASIIAGQRELQYTPASTKKDGTPNGSLTPIEIVLKEKRLINRRKSRKQVTSS